MHELVRWSGGRQERRGRLTELIVIRLEGKEEGIITTNSISDTRSNKKRFSAANLNIL